MCVLLSVLDAPGGGVGFVTLCSLSLPLSPTPYLNAEPVTFLLLRLIGFA